MKAVTLTILILALALFAGTANAALVTEYMEYGSASGPVNTLTTANTTGWGGNSWYGATPYMERYNVDTQTTNASPAPLAVSLDFPVPGYVENTNGGTCVGMGNDTSTGGGITSRELSPPASGVLWVSYLAKFTFSIGSVQAMRSQLVINNPGGTAIGIASGIPGASTDEIRPAPRSKVGAASAVWLDPSAITLTVGTYLVVGKLETVDAAPDNMTMWVVTTNANLSSQNVAALDAQSVYKFTSTAGQVEYGASITNVAMQVHSFANPATGNSDLFSYMDSIRISVGNLSDDQHVYEILTGNTVPEPAALFALAGLALVALRKR